MLLLFGWVLDILYFWTTYNSLVYLTCRSQTGLRQRLSQVLWWRCRISPPVRWVVQVRCLAGNTSGCWSKTEPRRAGWDMSESRNMRSLTRTGGLHRILLERKLSLLEGPWPSLIILDSLHATNIASSNCSTAELSASQVTSKKESVNTGGTVHFQETRTEQLRLRMMRPK